MVVMVMMFGSASGSSSSIPAIVARPQSLLEPGKSADRFCQLQVATGHAVDCDNRSRHTRSTDCCHNRRSPRMVVRIAYQNGQDRERETQHGWMEDNASNSERALLRHAVGNQTKRFPSIIVRGYVIRPGWGLRRRNMRGRLSKFGIFEITWERCKRRKIAGGTRRMQRCYRIKAVGGGGQGPGITGKIYVLERNLEVCTKRREES